MGTVERPSLAEARTAAVNLFVAVEAFYLFNSRSLTYSMWHVGMFSNRWILGGVAVQAVGQLTLTYVPAMNSRFQTAPIRADAWIRVFAAALLASVIVGFDKRLRNRRR